MALSVYPQRAAPPVFVWSAWDIGTAAESARFYFARQLLFGAGSLHNVHAGRPFKRPLLCLKMATTSVFDLFFHWFACLFSDFRIFFSPESHFLRVSTCCALSVASAAKRLITLSNNLPLPNNDNLNDEHIRIIRSSVCRFWSQPILINQFIGLFLLNQFIRIIALPLHRSPCVSSFLIPSILGITHFDTISAEITHNRLRYSRILVELFCIRLFGRQFCVYCISLFCVHVFISPRFLITNTTTVFSSILGLLCCSLSSLRSSKHAGIRSARTASIRQARTADDGQSLCTTTVSTTSTSSLTAYHHVTTHQFGHSVHSFRWVHFQRTFSS